MVYVFKTSVKTDEDIIKVKPGLDKLPQIIKWNFDLEDCDNILRIDASETSPQIILDLLKDVDFECQELE